MILKNFLNFFVVIYLNDILIFFKMKKKHSKHVRLVLNKFCAHKLWETLVVHSLAIDVHPLRTTYTPPWDRHSDCLYRLSFYLYKLSERMNEFDFCFWMNERANLIFASEKTREYSAFLLTKKAFFFDSLLKKRRENIVFFH